jgi:DNA modification methylase
LKPYFESEDGRVTLYHGDAREVIAQLPAESVQLCVTSPPYFGLRSYGVEGEIGKEKTVQEFVEVMVEVGWRIGRVLRKDGTFFLNLGDSYCSHPGQRKETDKVGAKQASNPGSMTRPSRAVPGLKPKDLCMIPARVAIALQEAGWWVRSEIVWSKPNPMPESCTDRPTKSHEYVFLLSKAARYFYDAEAVKEPSVTNDIRRPYTSEGAWELDGRPIEQRHGGEPRGKAGKNALRGQGSNRDGVNGPANRDGRDMQDVGVGTSRNRRSVWTIATAPFPGAHFATFPPKLVEPCILAGTSQRGCCPVCGKAWGRVTAKSTAPHPNRYSKNPDAKQFDAEGNAYGEAGNLGVAHLSETLGWRPGCMCGNQDTEPCVVLDPFNGAGTTGLVALRLGRRYIGIDLKPEYLDMTIKRLEPLLAQGTLALAD